MMVNTLYYGDNLDVLQRYIKDESVDLIYLDPAFNSNATYNVLFAERNGTRAAAASTGVLPLPRAAIPASRSSPSPSYSKERRSICRRLVTRMSPSRKLKGTKRQESNPHLLVKISMKTKGIIP